MGKEDIPALIAIEVFLSSLAAIQGSKIITGINMQKLAGVSFLESIYRLH